MEYVKGQPYFCLGQEKIKQYPYLEKDMDCYLLIIGGGIDGAIANFYLSQKYDVALVDKGRFGFGCTSCATALLEYQLDEYALDLKSNMSQEEIVLAYRSALKAFDKIENFIKNYGSHSDFYRRPTLLYTNSILNQKSLEEEFNFRTNNNFPCQLLDSLTNPFPFEIKKAIYCENGGCELNPYLFTKQMIENSPNQDKIFQNTGVEKIEKTKSGFTITTSFSQKIRCKKVLVATGFNWEVLKENNLC